MDTLKVSILFLDCKISGLDPGEKSFSLRVGLTTEPSRTLAQDGSFVVNGESPLPRPTQPPMPPQPIQPRQQMSFGNQLELQKMHELISNLKALIF